MASARDGDDSRLRIGGWLPESEMPDIPEPADPNPRSRRIPSTDRGRAVAGGLMGQTSDPSAASELWKAPPRDGDGLGPAVMDDDPWDFDPDVDLEDEAYHGRRRAGGRAARLWMVIALAVLGLGGAIAIPLALALAPGDTTAPVTGPPDALAGRGSGEPATATSSPGPSPSSSATPKPAPSVPRFTSATFEAEASTNNRSGSARVRVVHGASGRRIVNRIGDWTDSESTEAGNGTLTVNVTVPAAGTYTLTVFYTFLEDDPQRTAMITIAGAAPRNVAFARPNGCCLSSVKISITLKKGANSLLFSNSVSRAPAIDKIVISRS